jgi:hypothetical protein
MKRFDPVRPPAVPLVACDPYFSLWSFNDTLTESWTRHWTGRSQCLAGLVRVDGQCWRYMGMSPWMEKVERAAEQRSLQVTPTRTTYVMSVGDAVELTLTFVTPMLPHDMDLVSRPITYVSWSARSLDGRPHAVQVYFDAQSDIAVDHPSQAVAWSRHRLDGLHVLRVGSVDQPILKRAGDDLRIDWGYLYLSAGTDQPGYSDAVGYSEAIRAAFARGEPLPHADDLRMPRAVNNDWPVLAIAFDLGKVGADPVTRHAMLGYDDVLAIEYLHRKLPAYWRRAGMDFGQLLTRAHAERDDLLARSKAFDDELHADLVKVGGEAYAGLCALAYRQCLAAHKLAAEVDGTPMHFSKENYSNGCIATVDVTYPASPFFLLFNPALLKAQVEPILRYAATPRWRFPFAPHDLGTYPLANGQVYGGGERTDVDQMPVEECGNMLLILAALAKVEGNAEYARSHWPLLTKWADYLLEKGYNPENQLCTDDFAGHLASNTNLSLKAILALAGYAQMCRTLGVDGSKYDAAARGWAKQWVADADDGDHYRLAFDRPGTWSQKYNLVWDTLLDLNVFPADVARKEIAFYKSKNTKYGLPLDSRKTYTKLDWIVWTATMAERPDDFRALVDPLLTWANQSPSRVPLTDWYETADGKIVGFQARSVVGGIFIKLMGDRGMWKKWSARAR